MLSFLFRLLALSGQQQYQQPSVPISLSPTCVSLTLITVRLLVVLYCRSAVLSVVSGQSQTNISFVLQTAAAAFAPRWWSSVESYPKAITVGGTTLPANSLVLFGGSTDGGVHFGDVWGSSDQGRTWVQISANAFTGTRFPGYTIDSQGRLFKVAGSDTSDVWMSTNGVTWTQQMPGSPATQLPPRSFPDVQVDSKDVLYVVAGLAPSANGGGLNDGTSRQHIVLLCPAVLH